MLIPRTIKKCERRIPAVPRHALHPALIGDQKGGRQEEGEKGRETVEERGGEEAGGGGPDVEKLSEMRGEPLMKRSGVCLRGGGGGGGGGEG